MWDPAPQTQDPWHWEDTVLATGFPGKFLKCSFHNELFPVLKKFKQLGENPRSRTVIILISIFAHFKVLIIIGQFLIVNYYHNIFEIDSEPTKTEKFIHVEEV